MDVGAALRNARERRSLSLDQLSRATKIRVANLRAIENNEVDKLPGGIFTRGLLRAYAREVGLDLEDTVQHYLAQFEHCADIVDVARQAMHAPRAEKARVVRDGRDPEEAERRAVPVLWLVGVVALVIGFVGYVTFTRWRAPAAPSVSPTRTTASAIGTARSSSVAPSPPAATAAGTETGSPAPTRAIASDGDVLHVDVRAQGLCWLSVISDGARVVYRLMQPGERQTIDVHDDVVLRIGDPAAFAFLINGTSGRPLGRAGDAVTVRITRQNYREFLSP